MKKQLFFILLILFNISCAQQSVCKKSSIRVQVLGSGGPELTLNRASSAYLIWLNEKAIVLLDTGGGSALRFGDSQANWKDLKAVLFSHYHADHSSDFPALIKASWFGDRNTDLPIIGPYGNDIMPSTTEFLAALFDVKKGAFKYLSDFYNNKEEQADYHLIPTDLTNNNDTQKIYSDTDVQIFAQQVIHGPIPAFAYVIKICDQTIVYSGDTNGSGFENLKLDNTDLFIAHNAIPEQAGSIAKYLHMTPTQIGELAKHLHTKKLILSHRMKRTLGKEQETLHFIKQNYQGDVEFADDLESFSLDK
jgi:ribonuclease BN (tRNA processing enzyme)